ncbi:TonB-dependent siderophore receptor [Cupriavidus necator]
MNSKSTPRQLFRPTAIALAIAAAQCFMPTYVAAQTATAGEYRLPSAPLEQTLLQIAKQSGLLISYDPALVKDLKSAPVEGKLNPTDAIKKALGGTGLELVATPGGQWTLRRVPAQQAAQVPPAVAATASAGASAGAATAPVVADAELPLISVAAQRDSGGTGFVAESSSSFSRTDTPLSETPKSVTVVNAAVIQSQSAKSLPEILRNASGVVTRPGPFGVPTYTLRGFAGTPVMSDGVTRSSQDASSTLTPTIAISSVEVIKGPSAIIAGDAPPGGVINIVKKTPQAEPFYELQAAYGMYGYTQLAFDSTGALTEDKKLRYRIVVSADKAGGTAMGYDGGRHFYLAPTLQWKDDSTDFTIGYSRTTSRDPFPQYTVGFARGGYITEYTDHPLGNEKDHFSAYSNEANAKLEQKLGNNVTFISRFNYTRSEQMQDGWAALSTIAPNNSLLMRGLQSRSIFYNMSTQNYLRWKTDFGSVKSTTLVGFDYTELKFSQFDNSGPSLTRTIPNVFGNTSLPPLDVPLSPSVTGRTGKAGTYIQEQLSYKGLNLLASLRSDNFVSETTIVGAAQPSNSHQRAVSPSVGIMYQLTPEVATYASWNKGFQPGTARTVSGELLPPRRSEQVEAGFKFNLLDDKVFITTSAYRISYTNQPISDPVNRGFSIASSGAVSRGFEFELQGQILPGLNVTAQYAYNNYQQDYAPTVKVNLPKHTGSVWATYNFRTPILQGFGVGGGMFFASNQYVGNTNLYRLPGQVQTDLAVFYRQKKMGLNLSVKNVFNRKLYYSTVTPSFIPMGPSRTVLLTGTYDF